MSLMTMIYLADISASLSMLLFLFGFLCFILGCMLIFAYYEPYGRKPNLFTLFFVPSISLVLISTSVLFPSKDGFYKLAAVQVGQNIMNNPKVDEVTEKLYNIISAELDGMQPKKDTTK